MGKHLLIFSRVLLFVLIALPLKAHSDIELEWCLDDHPNWHNYPEEGEPYGLTVDLMRLVSERAGFTLKFSPNIPFARCLAMMKDGKTDLMTSLNYSDERAQYMHFIPYDVAKSEVLFLRKQQADIATREDLKGKSVILIRGYAYNTELPAIIKRKNVNVIEAVSLDMGFAMLLLERADTLIGPAQSSINVIQDNPRYHSQFKQASYSLPFTQLRHVNLGFSKKSLNSHFYQHLQNVISDMVEEGVVKQYRYEQEAGKDLAQ